MKKFYDTTSYECYLCGHKWIVRSDRLFKGIQLKNWLNEALKEHYLIHKELEK